MKIVAEEVRAGDLQPGDLFSIAGQNYWDMAMNDGMSVGQKVYIRTNTPTPIDQADEPIFRLVIER